MRKIEILLSIIILTCCNLHAQETRMRDILSKIPDTLLPYLSHNNKLDLIDFIESGMTASVTNGFEEQTQLTKLTDNYMKISLSQSSYIEMKLLDAHEKSSQYDKVLCVVFTIGEKQLSSTIKFYTPNWEPINIIPNPIENNADKLIIHPENMNTDEFNTLKKSILPITIYANLNDKEDELTIGISPLNIHSEEEIKVRSLLKPITLKWHELHFK